jgi:hypothetical protein
MKREWQRSRCRNRRSPIQSRSRQQRLTALTPAWYAGARARVEARATLQQAEELRTVLEELGERFGE